MTDSLAHLNISIQLHLHVRVYVYGSELFQLTSTLMSPNQKMTFLGNILVQEICELQEKDMESNDCVEFGMAHKLLNQLPSSPLSANHLALGEINMPQ